MNIKSFLQIGIVRSKIDYSTSRDNEARSRIARTKLHLYQLMMDSGFAKDDVFLVLKGDSIIEYPQEVLSEMTSELSDFLTLQNK